MLVNKFVFVGNIVDKLNDKELSSGVVKCFKVVVNQRHSAKNQFNKSKP